MPKSRIYEIAQELNKTNKEVIEFLKDMPKNTVGFLLKNNANNDIWKNILA